MMLPVLFLILYMLPLLLTALLAVLLYRLIFRGRRWGMAISVALALAASCVQPVLDRIALWRDLDRYAADEIRPDRLILPPGRLLHLQEGNHAGVTCDAECPFDTLSFVTGSTELELRDAVDWPLNLWDMLPEADPAEPFPYRYAFVSVSTTSYAGMLGLTDLYRKPDWPDIGVSKGVHMLVEIPQDGVLDLTQAPVHFRRFNLQADLAMAPFWGIVSSSTIWPEVGTIFADLAAVTRPQ
ncbi:hypothetical protein ACFOMH_00445 [Paracoccus mangrovi]|uniref:Uncharacterized protein n=1 Tax=Paracoccus mangrovi TaxID=1715645 RepID=A0ABV7R310_9RHOB